MAWPACIALGLDSGRVPTHRRTARQRWLALAAMANYELPVRQIVARREGRRTCEKRNALYHLTERPPQVERFCDRSGNLFQPEDDRPESTNERLEANHQSTAPLSSSNARSPIGSMLESMPTRDFLCEAAPRMGADRFGRTGSVST